MAVRAIAVGLFIVLVGLAWMIVRQDAHRRARLGRLISKYNDVEIARQIVRREVWEGQTESQLVDSIGAPAAVDHGLRTGVRRQIWKYRPRGENRFRLRIILDNGVVTGWEHE